MIPTEVARSLTARNERLDGDSENFIVAATLTSGGNPSSNMPGRHHEDDENLVAFDWQASAGHDQSWHGKGRQHIVRSGNYAGAVSATRTDAIASPAIGVRRLTPMECERLQSWPDGWTRYTADGKDVPDSVRYRLIGNGVVSNVAEWIGRRLVAVNAQMNCSPIDAGATTSALPFMGSVVASPSGDERTDPKP